MCNICLADTEEMVRLQCSAADVTHDMCHGCFKSTIALSRKCPYCRKEYQYSDIKDIAEVHGVQLPRIYCQSTTEDVINDILERGYNDDVLSVELYEEFHDVVDWEKVFVVVKDYIWRMHVHMSVQPKEMDWTRHKIRTMAVFSAELGELISC